MTDDGKTKLMAIASWVLPTLTMLALPALTTMFPPSEMKSLAELWAYGIIYITVLFGALTIALALAITARRRSRVLHDGKYRKHATAGLFVSLPLLLCYAAGALYLLVWR